jgi:predicted MPP superfamily phosphohydrolase
VNTLAMRVWRSRRAVAALIAANLLLLGGYITTFSELVSRFHLPPRLSLYAGAGALAYLILATVVLIAHFLVGQAKHLIDSPRLDPSRRRLLDLAGTALVASPIAVMGYGTFVQRTNFRVREIDLPMRGLPHGLDGVRLLQLSDIHLSAFLSEAEFARVVDASNELRPHVALVTGDFISSSGDPLDACLRQIARLRSDTGVFATLGNHERYAHAEDYTAVAAGRLGVRLLRYENQVVRFGESSLNLAGIDYELIQTDRSHYLRGCERLIVPGAFNVLLSHNPDVFPVAAHQGYNLTLAGHTHGGQVTIEILDQSINPARFFTPYVAGEYRQGNAAAYVTRGVGTIGIPVRVGAPPEITLLRLRKA